jgi:hypothetical protein
MSLKTYGDRPISFQLEENGEFYCIGSEVKHAYFQCLQICSFPWSLGWKLSTIVQRVSFQEISWYDSAINNVRRKEKTG